jgi:hypothetical protein
MRILSFNMSHPGKNKTDYLAEKLGKEQSEKCIIESNATATKLFFKVNLLNFKNNSAIIDILAGDEFVQSIFLINGKNIKKIKPS